MKVEINKLPKSEVELKIQVPAEEWQEFLNETAKELSKSLKVEGFRPGFVPFKIVEEKIGINPILEHAAEHCIQKSYVKAILENKIEALGQPEVSIIKLAKDAPFEFKAKAAVMPEVKLPDYKKIASRVEIKKVSVDEKEVSESLNWVQKSRAKLTLKLGPCKKGDWVEIEYSSKLIENNKKIEDAFVLGEGKMLPGFQENVEGMSENQEKTFALDFPKDHFSKELAGKSIEFQLKLKSVKKLELPEITDEFAKTLGNFSNVNALKNSLKEGIAAEKENEELQRMRQQILDKIGKESEIEIPQALIVREQNRLWQELKQNVSQKFGISVEDYLTRIKKTEKEVIDSFLPEAEKRIKNSLILREVSRKEDVKVSENELKEETQKIMAKYPDFQKLDPQQLKDYTEEVLISEKTFKLLESFIKKP